MHFTFKISVSNGYLFDAIIFAVMKVFVFTYCREVRDAPVGTEVAVRGQAVGLPGVGRDDHGGAGHALRGRQVHPRVRAVRTKRFIYTGTKAKATSPPMDS